MWYVTYWYYRTLALQNSCAFGKTVKRSSINSIPQIELSCIKATCRSNDVRSCAEITCRGHVDHLEQFAFTNEWSYNSAEVTYGMDSSRVMCKCQLIVRLKANKCYQEWLCYLSFYIDFLNIRLCSWLEPLAGSRSLAPDPVLTPVPDLI